MRLFDISLFLKRFPIKRAKEELLQISQITEADYEAFLKAKRAEIATYHLKNNSFYRQKVKGDFSTWESLPILKKADYQIPLKERLSAPREEQSSAQSPSRPSALGRRYCGAPMGAAVGPRARGPRRG